MDKKSHVNINNASIRKGPYQKVIEKIAEDAVCPFCPEHLARYHTPPILKTGDYWIVSHNMYPYDNASHHFILITKEHLTDSKDLSANAWTELQEMVSWLIDEYQIESGTLFMRSGNMEKTGATVQHLHAQFVVGSDPDKPVITRVG